MTKPRVIPATADPIVNDFLVLNVRKNITVDGIIRALPVDPKTK